MATWGTVYQRYCDRGEDRSAAAWMADQWEKRQSSGVWGDCPSTHCERRQECGSPHDCIVKGGKGSKGAARAALGEPK
jgi:hypothetical protein